MTNEKETTLKPCPFCGGEAATVTLDRHVCVGCEACDIWTKLRESSGAFSKWNTRTTSWIPVSERVPASTQRCKITMHHTDGTYCPCWKLKEEK